MVNNLTLVYPSCGHYSNIHLIVIPNRIGTLSMKPGRTDKAWMNFGRTLKLTWITPFTYWIQKGLPFISINPQGKFPSDEERIDSQYLIMFVLIENGTNVIRKVSNLVGQ